MLLELLEDKKVCLRWPSGPRFSLCAMRTTLSLSKAYKAQESQTLFPRPIPLPTETGLIPNPVPASPGFGRIYGNRNPNHCRTEILKLQFPALR